MMRPNEMTYFEEQQPIRKWVKYIVYSALSLEMLAMLFFYYAGTQKIPIGGEVPETEGLTAAVLITAGVLALMVWMFNKFSLTTFITQKGIYAQFVPFKVHFIPKEQITDVHIGAFPVFERGSYGVGYSIRNGKVFSMGTKEGIFVHLQNGKKYIISTADSQNAQKAIDKIKIY
ncbi:MAG: hypothetical protein WCR42_12750 [bacterium]